MPTKPFQAIDGDLIPQNESNLRILFSKGMLNLLSHAIETRLVAFQASCNLGRLTEFQYVSEDEHANRYSTHYELQVNGGQEGENLSTETFTVILTVVDNGELKPCLAKYLEQLEALLAPS